MALRELRLVLSQLLWRYEITPAEKDMKEFERKWMEGLVDHMILLKGALDVSLTVRSH